MAQKRISISAKHYVQINGWKYSVGIRFLLFFLLFLLFYFSLANQLVPQTYDIEKGTLSEKTIYAPKQEENLIATEKAKEDAASGVQPVYASIFMRNIDLVDTIFGKMEQVNTDDQVTADQKTDIYRREIPTLYKDFFDRFMRNSAGTYSAELIKEMKAQLTEQQYRIPEEAFFKIPLLTEDDLTKMETVTKDIVSRLMADQVMDVQAARAKVPEMVNGSQLTSKNARELVQEITRFILTPNFFYDKEATSEARIQARENTQTVYINKGDPLVMKGDLITQQIYEDLNRFGLLKDEVNYWPQLGILIMVSLFVFVLYMFIRQSRLSIATNNSHLFMLVLIMAINIIGMKIVALAQSVDYPFIGYLAPIAVGSMLISILLDSRLAFIASILFSILASIIYNLNNETLFDFRYGFVACVVCFVAIFAIHRASQRSAILKAGILVSLFSALSVISIILLDEQYIVKDVVLSLSFAFAGGLLTAVLVIGLLPFFEVTFGTLSPLKMVELSNPNHPLLRKLLTETPGTYHHSAMVGNLSEAAAEAIGADGLLCRVGSFYHDIGKTKRPSYFIENQVNIENPHDRIDPKLSKSIIIAHARDGVEMLKEYKIPKQICDIAEQHHGTTLLAYFYHKAMKLQEASGQDSKEITEAEYRYPGPKAQSKEAAIVGIADSVEAAVRSLRNPTIEQIDSLVQKIIKYRLDDHQLSDCDLTMKELDIVSKTLKETLLGIFHSRIEYPEEALGKESKS